MERTLDPNTLWQLAAPSSCACRQWGDECVVYDERSGATHLLAAGTTVLFRALQEAGPLSADTLVRLAFPDVPIEDRERAIVQAAMTDLERLSLVRSSRT